VSLKSLRPTVTHIWASLFKLSRHLICLGGEDFDNNIIEYFTGLWKKKTKTDASKDARAIGKLKREAEKAKRALSSQMSVRVEIESFMNGEDFSETLTRAKFEELNIALFKKTIAPVEKVMKDATGVSVMDFKINFSRQDIELGRGRLVEELLELRQTE
jgi:molecular chaperone DnaK (HSP70)